MRLRVLLTATIIAAALVRAAPAQADDLGDKRHQNKARQDQVRGQLDLALLSDAAVESRLNVVNAAVVTGQNRLEDARRAQDAAAAQVARDTRRLDEATARLEQTRRKLQAVAVRAYIRPSQFPASAGVPDVNAMVRGQVLLSIAAGSQTDALDATRQALHDRIQAKAVMLMALGTAAERTRVASDRAAQLARTQHDQQAVHVELQNRIADLRKESADLAAQEAGIEAVISARAAAARALAPQTVEAGPFSGGPVSGVGLIWPLHGPVTSEFGPRWGGFHPGIDIAPPFGTPIHAAKGGVVILAGPAGGYGNFVLIDHGGGIVTGYAHQSRLAVAQGQAVTQSQVIGYEGSTGDSTGPHLHFEVRVNASPQDPRRYEAGSP